VIAHSGSLQRLVFGECGGQRSQRGEAFRQACAQAGTEAVVSEDIARAIWEKFVFPVGLPGATASTRCALGPVRSHLASRRLLLTLMAKAVAVGRAEGVALPPDYAEDRLRFCDQLPADMTASMLGDLLQGHWLELPWLSGDISRRGALRGGPRRTTARWPTSWPCTSSPDEHLALAPDARL